MKSKYAFSSSHRLSFYYLLLAKATHKYTSRLHTLWVSGTSLTSADEWDIHNT